MRTGLIIGVLAALAATSAYAESWGLIRNDKDEAPAVDLGTRKHQGHSASQWIIAMYPTPQAFGNVRADYILTHEEYRCGANQRRSVAIMFYDTAGTALRAKSMKPSAWMDIPPDSYGTNAIEAACSPGAPPLTPATDAPGLLKIYRAGDLKWPGKAKASQ